MNAHTVIPFRRKTSTFKPFSSEALYQLAMDCYIGANGSPKTEKRAIFWLKLAADQGYPKACFYLGMFFTGHLGLKENGRQAVHWLGVAAETGNAEAMVILSKIFMRGNHGVPKDFRKASLLLRSAAELGDPDAQKAFSMILKASEGRNGREMLGIPTGKVSDIKEEQKYSQHLNYLRKLSGKNVK